MELEQLGGNCIALECTVCYEDSKLQTKCCKKDICKSCTIAWIGKQGNDVACPFCRDTKFIECAVTCIRPSDIIDHITNLKDNNLIDAKEIENYNVLLEKLNKDTHKIHIRLESQGSEQQQTTNPSRIENYLKTFQQNIFVVLFASGLFLYAISLYPSVQTTQGSNS